MIDKQPISSAQFRAMQGKPKKPKPPLESMVQKTCIRAFILKHPDLWKAKKLHSIPNGGHRNKIVAANMKLEGQVTGVWDLQLTVPMGQYAGLFIEMKRVGNGLTDAQKEFQESHKEHYAFAICKTVDEFLEAITNYLTKS